MGTENALQAPHQLQLDSRSRLHMTGVIEVESFDEATIVLTTTRGTLIVRGENLHLQLLRLDGGEVLVDGTVDSLSYEDAAPAGGFFGRLFCTASAEPAGSFLPGSFRPRLSFFQHLQKAADHLDLPVTQA